MTCRQATELVITKGEQPLTPEEEINLQSHLDLCIHCRHFSNQNAAIDTALAKLLDHKQQLSESDKNDLLNTIKSKFTR
jgi:predicted anti-sigma-YlaC factor YlaD